MLACRDPYRNVNLLYIFKTFWGGLVPGFVRLVLGIVSWVSGFVFWVSRIVFWVLGFVFWVSGIVFWVLVLSNQICESMDRDSLIVRKPDSVRE